jgi:hypothetical protein
MLRLSFMGFFRWTWGKCFKQPFSLNSGTAATRISNPQKKRPHGGGTVWSVSRHPSRGRGAWGAF